MVTPSQTTARREFTYSKVIETKYRLISTRTDSVTPLLSGATLLACMIPQFLPWADHCDVSSFESLTKTVRMRAIAEDENLRLLVRVADEAM